MQWLYLAGLLVSIAGMAVLDWRYSLALWHDRTRTLLTITAALIVFVVWDLAGIWLGIFHHGGSVFTLPVRLLPEFPIEEVFFLLLLTYCTLVMWRGIVSWRRI